MAAFVDTNVAVYVFDRGAGHKRVRAVQLLESLSEQLVVSTQVLSEFYWTVTRKLLPPLAVEPAREATGSSRRCASYRSIATWCSARSTPLLLDSSRCGRHDRGGGGPRRV